MGNRETRVAVLGGDRRELEVARGLGEEGYGVYLLGEKGGRTEGDDLIWLPDPVRVIEGARVVILPVPGTDDTGELRKTYLAERPRLTVGLLRCAAPDAIVFTGVAGMLLEETVRRAGLELIRLMDQDEVAIMNSIPTAEGVLQRAMELADITIHGSRALVLGLGRCGLTLARLLSSMGANVHGAARRRSVRARAEEMGVVPLDFSCLEAFVPEMDFIFNSVPAPVLDARLLERLDGETVVLDLASAPGGVDFEAAKRLGLKAELLPALPGRVAPRTAGEILYRAISGRLREAGIKPQSGD